MTGARGGQRPPAAVTLLRESQDRALEREGIPMVLALVDERPGHALPPADSEDGRAVAAALDRLRAELAATRRDGDLPVTTALLQAAAYQDATHRDATGSA